MWMLDVDLKSTVLERGFEMELGSWALISEAPSLIGLLPLLLYIILSFVIQDSMILPLAISLIVGMVMSGNGAVSFGTNFGAEMGGTMGQIGFSYCSEAALGVS